MRSVTMACSMHCLPKRVHLVLRIWAGSLCSNEIDMNHEAEQHLQQHAADLVSLC